MPAGTDKRRLWATWRNLIWSRAIENLAIVVTTQNLFSHAERGLAMVATPEEILFESTAAGLFVVDVGLDRAREMRTTTDTVTSALSYGAKQGVLGTAMAAAGTARGHVPTPKMTFYPPVRTRRSKGHGGLRGAYRRANLRNACLLAQTLVPNPVSDIPIVASTARQSFALMPLPLRHWHAIPVREPM